MIRPHTADPAAEDRAAAEAAGRTIKALAAYLPAHGVPALLALAVTPFVTRALGPSHFGVYAIATAVYSLAVIPAVDVGAGSLRRLYAAAAEADRPFLAGALSRVSWRFGSAAAGLVLAAAGAALLAGSTDWAWALAGAALVTALFPLVQYGITEHYVREAVTRTAMWQTVHSVLKAVGLVGGALLAGAAAGPLVGYALMLLVLALLLRRPTPDGTGDERRVRRRAFAYGGPIAIASVAALALSAFDRFVLATLEGTATAGRYSATYLIAEYAVLMLMTVAVAASYPSIVRLWEAGLRRAAQQLLNDVTTVFLAIAAAVVCVMAAIGSDVLRVLAGDEFEIRSLVPALVSGGLGWFGLARLEGVSFELVMRMGAWARLVATAAVLAAAATVPLVAVFGLEGAAIATLAGYAGFWLLVRTRAPEGALTPLPAWTVLAIAAVTAGGAAAAAALPPTLGVVLGCTLVPATVAAAARFSARV